MGMKVASGSGTSSLFRLRSSSFVRSKRLLRSEMKPIRVVMSPPSVEDVFKAIKEAHQLGWLLMGYDLTGLRPVVIFERH